MIKRLNESYDYITKEYTVWELEVQSPSSKARKSYSYRSEEAALDAIDRLIGNGWKVYSINEITRKIIDNDSEYFSEPKFTR